MAERAQQQKQRWYANPRVMWAFCVAVMGAAFALGWYLHGTQSFATPRPLRLTGDYHFISPLLSCNINSTNAFPQSQSLNGQIQSVITAHQNNGDIEKASVYLADFSSGKWANVNGSAKYYPSSLGKVPIMMAYLAMAENLSTPLDRMASYPVSSPDLNAQQEIAPEHVIVPGKNYTVSDLIQYMIKYSDNNAAQVLYDLADQSDLEGVYSNLEIPLVDSVTTSTLDFMTPQQYSILFRTLYNSTYLSRDASEDALNLMSQTSFTQGIVAGVPSSTVVSHKFGIVSFTTGGVTQERELHDCGIVYAPGHPYLVCIMTRGSSSLANMEGTIADISQAAYKAVEAQ